MISEYLLQGGLITAEQLDQAHEYQKTHGGGLGTCLLKMGLLSREALAKYLAHQHGIRAELFRSHKSDSGVPFEVWWEQQLAPLKHDIEYLLREGLVTSEQLEWALEYQGIHGEGLGTCLLKMGLVSREAVAKFLVNKHGVPFADLSSYKPDPDAVRLLPIEVWIKHRLVPLKHNKSTKELEVAMVDPGNRPALDDLESMTGFTIKPLVALEADLHAALRAVEREGDATEEETRLSEYLLRKGLISGEQLDQALEYQKIQGGGLSTCLLKLGLFSREAVAKFLVNKHGVPFADLSSYKPSRWAKLAPIEVWIKYRLVPLERNKSTLEVAMVDPGNQYALDELKFLTGFNIKPLVAFEPDVDAALQALAEYAEDESAIDEEALRPGKGGIRLLALTEYPGDLTTQPLQIQLIKERIAKKRFRFLLACRIPFADVDLEKIFEEKPHLRQIYNEHYCWERELPSQEADEVMKLLDSAPMRCVLHPCPRGAALDGGSYKMLIEREKNTIRLHWFDSSPRDWEPLDKIARMLIKRGDVHWVRSLPESCDDRLAEFFKALQEAEAAKRVPRN